MEARRQGTRGWPRSSNQPTQGDHTKPKAMRHAERPAARSTHGQRRMKVVGTRWPAEMRRCT
eukprot:1556091-Heterocapsa_arctica.AAC.1